MFDFWPVYSGERFRASWPSCYSVNSISVDFVSGAKISVITAVIISILVVGAVAVVPGICYWFHCKYIVDNLNNALHTDFE